MGNEIIIAPSILSGNFMDMASSIRQVEDAGAQWVHVDVMDGHFVPNLTMGVPFVRQLHDITALPLDVHLMISNPLEQIPWFLDAGADSVTFHIEAVTVDEAHRAIELIHAAGKSAALSIKPATDPEVLEPFIEDVDMVLVMSVEPGFSGQSYIEGSEDKVARIAEMARAHHANPRIQVDGGISRTTAPLAMASGADTLVCGNAFFKAEDPAAEVDALKQSGKTLP